MHFDPPVTVKIMTIPPANMVISLRPQSLFYCLSNFIFVSFPIGCLSTRCLAVAVPTPSQPLSFIDLNVPAVAAVCFVVSFGRVFVQ